MAAHARFAPSAAHRWVNCPGSTSGLEGYEDESDEYATEGTAAHELLKHVLEERINPHDQAVMGAEYNGVRVSTAMADTIDRVSQGIFQLIDRTPYDMTLEERLHAHEIHEDCWGTGDVTLYSEARRHLYIIDYKNGAGIAVFAEFNEQMIIYADGKMSELELMGQPVERVTLVISQPNHRVHEDRVFDLWETTPDVIKSWRKRFQRAIRDGKTLKAGKWCRLCPKAGQCDVQDAWVNEVLPNQLHGEEDYPALSGSRTPEQLAEILDRKESVSHWFAAVYRLAYDSAKLGAPPPGYEIRPIKKHRVWIDQAAAEKELHSQYGDVIYEERELRSPAQMEKIKGTKGLVAKHTTRPTGGETLEKIKS